LNIKLPQQSLRMNICLLYLDANYGLAS
jgi:hypothetical protein